MSRSLLAVALFGLAAPAANAQLFPYSSQYQRTGPTNGYPAPQVQYVCLPYPPQHQPQPYMYAPAPVQLPAPLCQPNSEYITSPGG